MSSSKLLLPSPHLPPTSNTGCPAKVFSSVGSACSTASAAKEAMYSHHQASASVSGPSKTSWSCRDQIQNTTSSKWQLYFFFCFSQWDQTYFEFVYDLYLNLRFHKFLLDKGHDGIVKEKKKYIWLQKLFGPIVTFLGPKRILKKKTSLYWFR